MEWQSWGRLFPWVRIQEGLSPAALLGREKAQGRGHHHRRPPRQPLIRKGHPAEAGMAGQLPLTLYVLAKSCT